MVNQDGLSEDELKCGICFELLVDPTTLTCGHTICRYCLAQWWYRSKNSICPQCRQVWHGIPKVNVTLRNAINALFPEEVDERKRSLEQEESYKSTIEKFESLSTGHNHSPSNSRVSWTFICIFVALSVFITVVVSVAVRKIGGLSTKDLMSKSLEDWSAHDVGMWIGGLGEWAQPYEKVFVESGIDGTLLSILTDRELLDPNINMTLMVQRTKLLLEIERLKEVLPKNSFGLWQFKEKKSDMAMFIMVGVREYPRATIAYLYLFNYWDAFLPLFFCTVTVEGDHTIQELIKMDKSPTVEQWLEFLPKFLLTPYALVYRMATYFLTINYWTSRIVIMHSILMTLTELSRVFSIRPIRRIPYLSLKCFGYVIVGSMLFKFFWQFVPFFIADCIFYWMLYVSPFDALNRLLKTIWSYWRHRPNAPGGGGGNLDPHVAEGPGVHEEHQGWHFNLEWNTHNA